MGYLLANATQSYRIIYPDATPRIMPCFGHLKIPWKSALGLSTIEPSFKIYRIRRHRGAAKIEGLVLDPTVILLLVFLLGPEPIKEAAHGDDNC